MKLKRLIIKNFRSYKDEIQIPIDDFTALIGKNDIGKSTILEAMEIFFNNKLIKLESTDACVHNTDKEVVIGCVFSDFPQEVILDSQSSTTLADEYLLNSQGELEIHKIYDCSLKSPKETIYTLCYHPQAQNAIDLIKVKNPELKKRAKELSIDLSTIDQRSNPDLRHAIRLQISDLQLKEQLISLNEENAKSIWGSLEKFLPQFALFQADRPSKDEDSEVQDPMKFSIEQAIKTVEHDLEQIKETVHRQVMDVATRTLEKLRQMDPALATELAPQFKSEPKWEGLFKLSLTGDDQIPINKRGSGVRRLVLLNFFRAEVERKQAASGAPGVIYAIEEPETAQHPNNQKMLIEALLELSQTENCQVMITTHVPGLAGLIDVKNLRYIEKDAFGNRRITHNEDSVYQRIADQLGVIPDQRVKVFVCVEGPHDIRFLKHVSHMLRNLNPIIPDLENDPRIIMLHLGGSTLKDWVSSNYLKTLGIPEVHIYDRDEGAQPKYIKEVNLVNSRGNGSIAFYTSKREMENYIHPAAIAAEYGFELTFSEMDDVPTLVAQMQHAANSDNPWELLEDIKIKKKVSQAKKRLNHEVAMKMTYKQLCEIDTSRDVESWFTAIMAILGIQEAHSMAAPTVEA
ncbi:ATP-binding protein [Paenibacillus sonchi]|uniref:ATP-binding protein n=1 Tax=Paenibacillus sonchi TaxID=373687 RepID=A0A974P7R5_9BACL|nr:ATP-binding protein [Paenibacillus sonchi]QQZ58969.1 ATP-binding protein [Paenibacillus sonchi]